MPRTTSLVVVRYQDEFLIVEGNQYASERNRVPLRVKLPLGSTKEDARPYLRQEDLPDDVYSPSVHVGTPYGKRTPSGNNMVFTARALVPSGIWGFVKGECGVDIVGENPLDCAVRELQEETSLEADRSRLQRIEAIRGIDAYILDVTEKEKTKIKDYLERRNVFSRGEIFGNFWSTLDEIPPGLAINHQSKRVLDYLRGERQVVLQPPPGPVTRSRSGESAKKRTAPDDVVFESPLRSTRSRSGDKSMSPVPTFPSLASAVASPATMVPPGQWVPTAAPAPAPAPATMVPPGQWVPTAAPAPEPAPAASRAKYVPPHRRGGKTRRKKTARKRRTTRKVR